MMKNAVSPSPSLYLTRNVYYFMVPRISTNLFSNLNHAKFENENENVLGEIEQNPVEKVEWKPLIAINFDATD